VEVINIANIAQGPFKVEDVMTKRRLFSVREDTPIDDGG